MSASIEVQGDMPIRFLALLNQKNGIQRIDIPYLAVILFCIYTLIAIFLPETGFPW